MPLPDGTRRLGQIIAYQKGGFAGNVACGFTLLRVGEGDGATRGPDAASFIAIRHVTREGLDLVRWPVVGQAPVPDPTSIASDGLLHGRSYLGMNVVGSGIIDRFLEACVGLRPWDEMFDPRYYDRLLVSPDMRPSRVVYAKARPD